MSNELPKKFLRRAIVKTILRRGLAVIMIAGMTYGVVAVIYATKTIFKVKKNYAVVLERFGGQREAVTDIGWHARLPYFTRIEQEEPLIHQGNFLLDASEVGQASVPPDVDHRLTLSPKPLQDDGVIFFDFENGFGGVYDGHAAVDQSGSGGHGQ